jgi:hypothetical protein
MPDPSQGGVSSELARGHDGAADSGAEEGRGQPRTAAEPNRASSSAARKDPNQSGGRPLAPQECCHKLCHEPAAEAISVFNPWHKCVFAPGGGPEDRRGYALCAAHFERYCPRGLGYMRREDAVALRIQCREAAYA